MLNAILAYATAAAMLMGAGSVPAVPETAVRTTVENIVISCGDESVALDHEFAWTEAIGSSEAAFGFEISKNGNVMLPMQAKITPEEMLFALSDSGSVYSVSEAFAAEYIGLEESDVAILTEMAGMINSVLDIFPSGSHMAFAAELYDAVSAHEAAEALQTGDAVTEGVALYLENGADYAFVDEMRESDAGHLSAFMQWGLDVGNLMDGTEYSSHTETYAGDETFDSYTMYKTVDGGVDPAYKLTLDSKGEEGELTLLADFRPGFFSISEQSRGGDYPLRFSCLADESGITEASFSFGYADTAENTYGAEDEYTDTQTEDVFLSYSYTREGGLAGHHFLINTLMESSSREDGTEYYFSSADTAIDLSAKERVDESGAVITGVECNVDGLFSYSGSNPTDISLNVAFDVRSVEIPYTGAFEGVEIIPILNEDDVPPQLMGDTLMLASRISLLMYDDQLNEMIEMIERSVKENNPMEKRLEEKYKAREENTVRSETPEDDVPEAGDDPAGMKYRQRKKEDFYKKDPNIYFN